MGGGDDAPEPPDYTEVIDSIKSTLGYTQQQAEATFQMAKDAYEKYGADTAEFADKAFSEMDSLYGTADAMRKAYEMYGPAAAKQLQDALELSSKQAQEEKAGAEEQRTAAAIKQQLAAAQERLEALGVPPDQARSQAAMRAAAVMAGGQTAAAGNTARLAAREEGRQALAQALAQGNTTAQLANQTSATGTTTGQTGTNAELAAEQTRSASMGNPATWAGLTGQGQATWAQTLGQDYQNQMDKYKADEESGSGWGQIAGLGASLLTAPMTGGGSVFGSLFAEEGGAIPDPQMFATGGGPIPVSASPSGGRVVDDVNAVVRPGGAPAPGPTAATKPAQLNAGEFVIPEDVMKWMGEKGAQQMIIKARKEMAGGNGERPAQPTGGPPPPSYDGAGAIPVPAGVA